MARQRIPLTVHIDLDPVEGTFHTAESAREQIHAILHEMIPHYHPAVEVPEPGAKTYRDFAIRITADNMSEIKLSNGGEEISIPSRLSYFIVSEDPSKMHLVLPDHIFRRCFRFGHSEILFAFNEVKEIV